MKQRAISSKKAARVHNCFRGFEHAWVSPWTGTCATWLQKRSLAATVSCRLCNIFVLRAMSSFHHLSFQSQLGSLLFSLLLQVISLCLWQARAPAVERPRCAFGCLCLPCLHACHVPSPLASPCARRGTPEVRLWLSVFALSPSCPFAFGKPVRPPYARGAPLACVHHVPLPLASPCARCGTCEVRLWLSVFALSPCMSCPFAFGKPVRPPWNARGAPLACVHHVPLPLASPCARCGTPEVRLWLSVFALSPCMSCPFASGKPVRPPWNARGAPLAVCLCSLPSCHAFASPSWHICCDMKVLVSCCIIRAVSKKQRSKEGSFVCKHAAWPHSAPISLFAFLEPHSAQNCLKIEYTLLQFSCVFPVAYSCVQFPAVAFQLHSSCKFQLQILFPLGEAFAGAKTKQTDPN